MPSLPTYKSGRQGRGKKVRSRRNTIIYLVVILCMSWTTYMVFLHTPSSSPASSSIIAGDSADLDTEDPHGEGGGGGIDNAGSGSTKMIQVQDLPPNLLPKTGKHGRHSGKLVIVGDVHGMKDALVELLAKVGFDEKRDHLILAGDMISKGPDSRGVVALAMSLGASGIRGNHEDRVIVAHAGMKAEERVSVDTPSLNEDEVKKEEVPVAVPDEVEDTSRGNRHSRDRALVKSLGKKRMNWLKKCPVILRVGNLGKMGEVVVVHAGLTPGVRLEKQDPSMVMNMRTMSDDGVPSVDHSGKGWMKVWNKYQKNLPKKERTTVIYGHDSKRGLREEKYSIGIDTGCLRGGKLTAVVIEGGQSAHTHKLVQVKCKDGRKKKDALPLST